MYHDLDYPQVPH